MDTNTETFFQPSDLVSSYTRRQAIEDGVQADMNAGITGEVTRENFKSPVYVTSGVFEIMSRAVANKRWCNDWRGVWADVCNMARMAIKASRFDDLVRFQVIIRGAGRKSLYTFLAQCGPVDIDSPEPCITIMLPEDN